MPALTMPAPPQLASAAASAVEEEIGFAPDAVLILTPRTIPRTPNGKIRHAVLRRALLDGELGVAAG